jgi:RNA polymerase sigma-70 factor (ECF subfamily)
MTDEKDFILLLIAGNAGAWRLFEKLFLKVIFAQALGIVKDNDDADDVCQNVYIKVYKNIKNFKGDCELKTWVNKITGSESLNFLKAKKLRLKPIVSPSTIINDEKDNEDLNGITDNRNPEKDLENKQTGISLNQAVETLKGDQKKVFTLHEIDDISIEAIALLINKTPEAIRQILFRARENLKKILPSFKK